MDWYWYNQKVNLSHFVNTEKEKKKKKNDQEL